MKTGDRVEITPAGALAIGNLLNGQRFGICEGVEGSAVVLVTVDGWTSPAKFHRSYWMISDDKNNERV